MSARLWLWGEFENHAEPVRSSVGRCAQKITRCIPNQSRQWLCAGNILLEDVEYYLPFARDQLEDDATTRCWLASAGIQIPTRGAGATEIAGGIQEQASHRILALALLVGEAVQDGLAAR